MIICCALAFSLLDNGFFIDFCVAMCPSYVVPDRSSFFIKHIAAEATYVLKLLQVFLAQFIHLTLSFDGWSMEGLVMTGVSTSAENIFNRLLVVLGLYIAVNFSLVVSDTTKNVKKCCALICKKFPWILNCPDPCHQLNLLAKDLVLGSKSFPKIKAFGAVMKIVNGLTNYFSHSNYGKHHLRDAMKDEKDKRGIEAGGATRFSTFATHASSVLRCLSFMERCYSEKTITFNTKGTRHLRKYVESGSDENGTLRMQLNQIGRLLNPIARALKTLEGQQTTCSDVFFIYIGLAVAFQRAFNDPDESFYISHQAESYAAFDRRFKIFMNDCTPGMFLLAYFLDPIYYSDSALKLNLPPRATFSKDTAPVLARMLIRYARQMLATEQLREQQGGAEEGELLVKQLIAYMYREAPFNDPCIEPLFRLTWWNARVNNSDASQLAKLGIKLFSVSPSEMCDERTASKMTANSTAKRNGLAADNIIQMGILEKYWKYGFTTSNVYTHTARLVLDDFTAETAPPTSNFPAPTLQDPFPIDVDSSEDTLFNNPDPYGQAALSDDEDDADEDAETVMAPTPEPTAPRLAIEEYINLAAPAILARLDPGNHKKVTGNGSSAGSTVPAGQKSKWTPQSTAWGTNNDGW
ncbi:ribonuclease H-like domain-containing protein [Mycena galericulata]|nr:ribonuclease H-like domain-containing protein [Mycena galericulata]